MSIETYDLGIKSGGGCVGGTVSSIGRRAYRRFDSDDSGVFTISAAIAPAAVGGTFAIALYLALESGSSGLRVVASDETAFYAFAGFIVGFLERLAAVGRPDMTE